MMMKMDSWMRDKQGCVLDFFGDEARLSRKFSEYEGEYERVKFPSLENPLSLSNYNLLASLFSLDN